MNFMPSLNMAVSRARGRLRCVSNVVKGLAVATLVMLTACGETDLTAEEHIQRAQELRLEGDFQAAVLELKNALQQQPDNPSARFMLGEVYLRTGDGTSAEKEFERAVEAGMNAAAVQMPLARAWLLQNSYEELLDKLTVPDKGQSNRATVLAMRGRAYLGLGRVSQAEAAFEEALGSDDQSVDALVGLARVALARQDTETAQTYLKKAEAADDEDLEVIRLRGDLAFQTEDFEKAAAAYRTLRDRRPQYLVYRLALASAQIGQENYDAAIQNLDVIRKAVPEHPQVNYLRGLAAYRKSNFEDAKYYMDQVLAQEPNSAPALLIAGGASFALDRLEQARQHLERFTGMAPDYAPGLKLLAAVQMQMGENDAAMATLRPLTATPAEIEDQELLRLVATAALQSGDLESGRNYIEQAARQAPDDAALRAQLGISELATGNTEAGLEELRQATELAPEDQRQQFLYIANLIQAGRLVEARKASQDLQSKSPQEPLGYILEGTVLRRMGELESARGKFRKALEIDPGSGGAAFSLALLQIGEKDFLAAQETLDSALEEQPDNPLLIATKARVAAVLGNQDEVGTLLSRLVELEPDAASPRAQLARYYLLTNEPVKAEETIKSGLIKNPDNPQFLEILGRIQTAQGNLKKAVGTYERLVKAVPDNAEAHYRLANAYRQVGDWQDLGGAVESVLAIDPDHSGARLLKAELAIRNGDLSTAQSIAEELQKGEGNSARLHDVRAQLAMHQGDVTEAESEAEGALAAGPTTDRALRLARLQNAINKQSKAIETLETWVEEHPEDGLALLSLGNLYRSAGQTEAARQRYQAVTRLLPENWAGYNQLAWLLYENGQPKEALKPAERARELAPDNPYVLDTYGMVMLANGRETEAVRALERAADAGDSAPTRVNLAKAYRAAGRIEEAIRTLESLLESDAEFDGRENARTMLDQWRAKAE